MYDVAHHPCHEHDRIIVRIWTSGHNSQLPGQNVGHVSIETTTPVGYMSLWPTAEGKAVSFGVLKPIDSEFKQDYQDDHSAEARDPEMTICLYSLNAYAVSDGFNSIQQGQEFEGWALIGNNRVFNANKAHSCASLAYELLKVGGIYELISFLFSSRFSSVVSPDELSKAVAHAKLSELKQYPETATFIFSNETSTDTLQEYTKTACVIL